LKFSCYLWNVGKLGQLAILVSGKVASFLACETLPVASELRMMSRNDLFLILKSVNTRQGPKNSKTKPRGHAFVESSVLEWGT